MNLKTSDREIDELLKLHEKMKNFNAYDGFLS